MERKGGETDGYIEGVKERGNEEREGEREEGMEKV